MCLLYRRIEADSRQNRELHVSPHNSVVMPGANAVNGITEEQFTDGKKFVLSDSGITAVGTGETIQFVWTASPFTHHCCL